MEKDALDLINWYEMGVHCMNEYLWDPIFSKYHALDLNTKEKVPISLIGSIIPIVADIPTQNQTERMLKKMILAGEQKG